MFLHEALTSINVANDADELVFTLMSWRWSPLTSSFTCLDRQIPQVIHNLLNNNVKFSLCVSERSNVIVVHTI